MYYGESIVIFPGEKLLGEGEGRGLLSDSTHKVNTLSVTIIGLRFLGSKEQTWYVSKKGALISTPVTL